MVARARVPIGGDVGGKDHGEQRRAPQHGDRVCRPEQFAIGQTTVRLWVEGGPLERWLYVRAKARIVPQIRVTIDIGSLTIFGDGFETGSVLLSVPELAGLPPVDVWVRISTRRLYVGSRKPPADSLVKMTYVVEPRGNGYRVLLDLGEFGRDLIEMVRRKLELGWGP